ncbi:hypothetical protein PPYR_15425, partial [Photinus pyralis]
DRFLVRFLRCCNYSLEKTKNLLDLCYTVRSQAPELFSNRDPACDAIENILNITDMVPLPKLTRENYKIFIYRLTDSDPEKYIFADALKTFLAVADLRLNFSDDFPDGEIPIFDMSGFTLKHLYKVQLPILKKYMVYTQEAHPVRLKQIHVVNVSPFLDKAMAIVKPFMKTEVSAMLHFHQPNSTTLYKYIPQELLPEEYGGRVGKISDIKAALIRKMCDNDSRNFFLDDSRWNVDESKRPVENKHGKQFFGLQGSFRTLTID